MIGNLLGGLVVAILLAAPFVVPSIAGIATWKIIMGVIGFVIFVRAGLGK